MKIKLNGIGLTLVIASVILIGLIIFTLGLSKKIFIADEIGYYADNFFNSVANGNQPQFLISWFGSLSFL